MWRGVGRGFESVMRSRDDLRKVRQGLRLLANAEIGVDMSVFQDADHLVSWAGAASHHNRALTKLMVRVD